jgi:hypothetical protein
MAKYKLRAKETFETVVPASEIIFRHIITGEAVGKPTIMPERRWTTEEGYIYLARNKQDRDNCLKTGKWELVQ